MKCSLGVGTFIVRFQGSTKLVMQMKLGYAGALLHLPGRWRCRSQIISRQRNGILRDSFGSGDECRACRSLRPEQWGLVGRYNYVGIMLRFEAIGGSITTGFRVTSNSASDPSTIANQDVFQTYFRCMADAWGTSDYQVIAKSGVSI